MQERYCKCGNRVIVQYHIKQAKNMTVRFWLMGNNFGKTIRVCPHCGAVLDINHLQ